MRGVLRARSTPATHRTTRRARPRCSPRNAPACTRLPDGAAHGRVRADPQVPANTPMVTFEHGQYSVPHTLLGRDGLGPHPRRRRRVSRSSSSTSATPGPVEVARHPRATPGHPADHRRPLPARPGRSIPGDYAVRARNAAEAEFLALGDGAQAVADRGRRGRTPRMIGTRWPRRSPWPSSSAPARSTGPWATPPSTAASPRRPGLDPQRHHAAGTDAPTRAGEDPVADPGHQRPGPRSAAPGMAPPRDADEEVAR